MDALLYVLLDVLRAVRGGRCLLWGVCVYHAAFVGRQYAALVTTSSSKQCTCAIASLPWFKNQSVSPSSTADIERATNSDKFSAACTQILRRV